MKNQYFLVSIKVWMATLDSAYLEANVLHATGLCKHAVQEILKISENVTYVAFFAQRIICDPSTSHRCGLR